MKNEPNVSRSIRNIFMLGLFLVLSLPSLLAQSGSVSGRVFDAKTKEPLMGAAVTQKGTTNGVITDLDGNFYIKVPSGAVLEVRYIGFATKEVPAKGTTPIRIFLDEDAQMLNEVVAIGYGTTKKRDLTGAIASIKLENSPRIDLPNMNVLDALKGQLPGFDVGASTNAGGNPSVNIRGQNSIKASKDPLLVVDGAIFVGSFNEINPADIASVDILKDASSAAVYGSRSANGVILITTKRGASEKPTVRFRGRLDMQTYTKRPTMASPENYVKMKQDLARANGSSGSALDPQRLMSVYEWEAYEQGNIVDWFGEATRLAPAQDYQLSISGGNEKVNYYISGQMLDQKGVVVGDQFKKYSINAKIETKVTDWLKLGVTLGAIDKNADGHQADLRNATINSPFGFKNVRFAGYENWIERYPQGQTTTINPLWRTQYDNEDRNQNYRSNFMGRLDAPWAVLKGLSFTTNYSLNRWEGHQGRFYHEDYYVDTMKESDLKDPSKFLNLANGSVENKYRTDWYWSNLLNYNRTFGDHSIDATLLAERQSEVTRLTIVTAKDFSGAGTTVLGLNSMEKGNPSLYTVNTDFTQLRQLAYMARANYVFKQRYHLSGSFRRDGYSGFAEGNKYGSFFSAAAAWTLSEESFIKDNLEFVDHLKVRASYGQNGNPSVGAYATFAKISGGYYLFGSSTVNTISAAGMANKALQWEKTGAFNIGFDFSILKERIGGTFNYYNSNTTNLLFDRAIPVLNGFQNVTDNIGKINNWGIELGLNSQNIKTRDFTWSSNYNFWMNRNKVVSLYGLDGNNDGVEDDDIANGIFIGKSLGGFYTYVWDGIIQQNDVEYMAVYGGEPGDLKFRDLNGDGKIDANNDRKIVGYSKPNFTMTLGNTFSYKNFDLYFMLNYIAGGGGSESYYLGENDFAHIPGALGGGGAANWLDKTYWTPETPVNDVARMNYTNTQYGYRFPRSRDFLRLQDVSLSYRFSEKALRKTPIKSLRFFLAGKNLLTFTKWEGYDPETGSKYAEDKYPVLKSFSVGVDVSF